MTPGEGARGPHRTWSHGFVPALLVCTVVLLAVAWVAGRQSLVVVGGPPRSLDAVRLGPVFGQPVGGYLAGLPARLPALGEPPVPALVQFDDGLVPEGAVDALVGVRPVTAVFRVPLARVQTALRFQPLGPVRDLDPATSARRQFVLAQQAARRAAAGDASRLTGRPARVAAVEATALGTPDCRCLLALLVMGDRTGLEALAGRPGVRAVDAAPAGTTVNGVALAPLLPEQTDVVGPVPDDGPLPP